MNVPEQKGRRDYHETKEHAGKSFPFNIYPCSIPLDFSQVPVHWHEEMEIISVKKGRGTVTVDMKPFPVSAGDAIAVFPGQLHGISRRGADAFEHENIIFFPDMPKGPGSDFCNTAFLDPIGAETISGPIHFSSASPEGALFSSHIEQLDTICEQRPYGYQLAVKSLLFQLLYDISCHELWKERKKPSASRDRMKQLLGYIEEHYGEKITIQQAASLCGYSSSHFMKYFKKYTGMAFIEYLNDYRLTAAGHKLLNAKASVTSIAQGCGFDNLSYFNRLFRQKYGLSPRQYRRQVKG